MKLNKKSLLFMVIAIFAILGVSLGMVQSQQLQERTRLEQDLSLAQARLNKVKDTSPQLSSRLDDMEDRLVQTRSRLTTVKAGLFQQIETIEVDDALFNIAETCGVEIIEIASSAPADKKLDGVSFSILPLTVQIEGNVTNLIDFILKWTEEFHTGVVVSVAITPPGGSSNEEEQAEQEATEEAEQASAKLEMLIYTYRGD